MTKKTRLQAPKQDWRLYEEKCSKEGVRRSRQMTPAEALDLYEEMHNLAAGCRESKRGLQRLEAIRWKEKLQVRKKTVGAFYKLDKKRSERRDTHHSG